MFYLIGLGSVDPMDISVKGLEIVKRCSRVLETYYCRPLPSQKKNVSCDYSDYIMMMKIDAYVHIKTTMNLANANDRDNLLLTVSLSCDDRILGSTDDNAPISFYYHNANN
uniref:Diphthine methyl ester synthase n=1 Tax=Glossina austeni TaxID=7395 RepID=A0A1A9VGM3_GLOAU